MKLMNLLHYTENTIDINRWKIFLRTTVGPSVGATFFTRKIRMCSAKISKLLMIPLNSTFIKAINWQTLRKNNVSFYVARNVLRQRKLDFGDGFSVVFNNLGARWFDFTLVVSLRDDRLVKKPWRYQSKPRKDSLKCGNLGLPVRHFSNERYVYAVQILKPLMIPLNSILIKAFNWQTLRKNNASIIYVARVCPEYWN